jgi:alpha-L-rhamnosidase
MMKISISNYLILFVFLIFVSCEGEESIYDLGCNYKFNPVGIDSENPVLSWKIKSDETGRSQSAYRIVVSNAEGEEFWDTGKIHSDQSILIPYHGKELKSGTTYFWKVKLWDEQGTDLKWSKLARWTTGIMSDSEWRAKWIGTGSEPGDSAPFFRKEFVVDKKVDKAYAFISGLGYYEFRINGKKVGENVLGPAQTDYEKRTFYNTYDVSHEFKKGDNALGIILGNGWYNQQVAWGGMTYGAPEAIL